MHERALDFHRAEAVPGNVEHIVHAAHDPEIAILILTGAVGGEVGLRDLVPVLLAIAFVVAVDRAQHGRPWLANHQEPALVRRHRVALFVHDFGHDAGEWARGRAGFGGDGAGERRDHDHAGFGLPPGIDDRTALVADHFVVPDPGFRVD